MNIKDDLNEVVVGDRIRFRPPGAAAYAGQTAEVAEVRENEVVVIYHRTADGPPRTYVLDRRTGGESVWGTAFETHRRYRNAKSAMEDARSRAEEEGKVEAYARRKAADAHAGFLEVVRAIPRESIAVVREEVDRELSKVEEEVAGFERRFNDLREERDALSDRLLELEREMNEAVDRRRDLRAESDVIDLALEKGERGSS